MADTPTVRQIRDHLAKGGVIARRTMHEVAGKPMATWVTSKANPNIANRKWAAMPGQDEPLQGYKLIKD